MSIAGLDGATNTIQLLTEYPNPYNSHNWRMNAQCRFVLPQDYTPQTNPKGFRMKLTLEGHATGGIDVSFISKLMKRILIVISYDIYKTAFW